jgi:Ca2+-binding RTX toxin-like protein
MNLFCHGHIAIRRPRAGSRRRLVALASSLLVGTALSPLTVLARADAADTVHAPVGQGFTITPSDLSFILKQIKIAEHHAATYTPANPCGTLVGNGPNQIPSPLVSYGLRTVDGSCNNLIEGQDKFGAADQKFPRLTTPEFKAAEDSNVPGIGPVGPPGQTTYASKSGSVVDSEPRTISNLIVDQTSSNPAAIAAAENPVRTQGNEGVVACKTDPAAIDCVPDHETLFIPNVTTDVGLSPPYNQLFTLFGQFFDHGVDLTTKSGGTVFVPLKDDDPLVAGADHIFGNGDDLPADKRFMVLTRAQNQPGEDGVLGTADDVQDATNTDSPWVDQSQTYTSHPSHQVFLREYAMNADGKPVSSGKLLGSPDPATADDPAPAGEAMATWASVKEQAATKLGLKLVDRDVLNIPMLAVDPYGKFDPGPNGLPQYVTASGLVEGNLANPVPVPADVKYVTNCPVGKSCNEGFLVDIAHNAVPSPGLVPDDDLTASADFASQPAGTYDNEMLDAHFTAGDGRVNENIGLTAIHQIFHSEHDRLVDDIKNVLTNDTSDTGAAALAQWKLATGADGWNGERLFQAARFITEMEYQHIVFEEFARKIQPAINPFEPFAFTQTEINPAVKAEFAHAVYRFGHSMLTDTVDRTYADGSHTETPLLDVFLNPPSFNAGSNSAAPSLKAADAAGAILMGASDQTGNELDEFVADTLRNNLLGLPLDLPTINMTRAREAGIPPLNDVRRQIWQGTNDGQLKPYSSWIDFGQNLKHPESLVNFVAAYGQHSTVTGVDTIDGKRAAAAKLVYGEAGADGYLTDLSSTPTVDETADNLSGIPSDQMGFMNSQGATWGNTGAGVTTTGVDDIDLWVGGLAEKTNLFGGLLGSTFNYVFENQMTDLQNGDRLYYLARTPGMNLRTQLEGNSFAELVMRNTDAHTLKADAFGTADCKFELSNLAGTPEGFATQGNTVTDDAASECDEGALLIRLPDGTIRYRERNSVDPAGINGQSVFNGTAGVDRIWGGVDNDTFLGNEGNDVIEGNDGADVALGGEGNDIITDSAGDDNPKGGPGNDALDAGPGLDIVHAGPGKDFTNGGANANETFAGDGDDFVIAGQSLDAVFGDSGDDYEEGGDQPDLMQGDSGNLFFLGDSNKDGDDILNGQGGDDDYDMEGGDDIGLGGPGIEKVAGAGGYDWEIGQGDPQPQNQDLDLPLVGLDVLTVDVRDKFNEVEALSGWKFDDVLKGDDLVPSAVGGAGFIGCDVLDQAGVNRISGLGALLPPLSGDLAPVVQNSASGTCQQRGPIWGAGNILLGGAGSDLFEGRGGDEIIDGDRYLSVRLSVRTNPANPASEIGSAGVEAPGQSAMNSQYLRDANGQLFGPTLQQAVFTGTVDPGNIVAVREVLSANNPGDKDTAVYSDTRASYQCSINGSGLGNCPLTLPTGATITVVHTGGVDGTDTLRNVEQLAFSDTTPPAAPTIGTATPGNASATVNWTAPTGVVTGYTVEVVDAVSEAPVRTITGVAPGVSSLVVPGLSNGASYRFRVQATNAFGTGPFSQLSNAVSPLAPTVAGAPTIGTAVPGNTSATVNWTPPASNGGSPITGYEVRVVNVATNAQVGALRPAGPAATSLVVTGLTNGTQYRFQVRALNGVGASAYSALSNTVAPATVPGVPQILNATAGNASATVRWNAPANNGGSSIIGYEVLVFDDDANVQVGALRPAGATATSLVVTGLTNGTQYRFRVRAVNAIGASAFSNLSNNVRPATAPGAPGIGNASSGVPGGGRVVVRAAAPTFRATARWTAPKSNGGAAITGYVVTALKISADGAVVRRIESTLQAPDKRTATMRLRRGVYRFVVSASNWAGESKPSARSNRVTLR